MNFQAVEANNGNLVDMFGTFVEIGGVQYTDNQKAKAICKIADDNGVAHKVHLYQGKGQLPQPAQLQQRHSFSLSTFQGNYQGQPYTGYSGFWKNGTQVNQQPRQSSQQTAPQQGQQSPQQRRQGTKSDDMVRIRSMALAYAKDLVVAEKITRPELASVANEFTAYIMTGRWVQDNYSTSQESQQQHAADGTQIDDDIPF